MLLLPNRNHRLSDDPYFIRNAGIISYGTCWTQSRQKNMRSKRLYLIVRDWNSTPKNSRNRWVPLSPKTSRAW